MIFTSARLALSDILSPPFRATLWKSLGSVGTPVLLVPLVAAHTRWRLDGRRVVAVEGEGDVRAIGMAVAWAHLDAVERVDEIPRDRRHNAKVDVPALRALLSRSGV